MNRNLLLNRALRGALAAGALAAAAPASVALADDDARRGRGRGDRDDDRDERRGGERAARRAATGTVKSIDAGARSFVLTTKQGDLTITTDGSTTFHGQRGASAAFTNLAVNQHVLVTGTRPNATTLLARRVMLLPARADQRTATVGVVSDLAGDRSSFRITPSGGAALAIRITADTWTLLKGTAQLANGVTARVVSVKDASGADIARRIQVPAAT